MLWKWFQACPFQVNILRWKSNQEWGKFSSGHAWKHQAWRRRCIFSKRTGVWGGSKGKGKRAHGQKGNKAKQNEITRQDNESSLCNTLKWEKWNQAPLGLWRTPSKKSNPLIFVFCFVLQKRDSQSVAQVQSFELVSIGWHRLMFNYTTCKLRNVCNRFQVQFPSKRL